MRVLDIPFNSHIGLRGSDKEGFIFMLGEGSKYENHIGTVHAGALYSLAEATSGEFLFRRFGELVGPMVPVVRRARVKYHGPGRGAMHSRARLEEGDGGRVLQELRSRGRTMISVFVEVLDTGGELVMRSSFEWFV
jgi:acyl-coenzyme A thioesterase PaaI-like protein